MNLADHHPDDVLATALRKTAFLSDAMNALTESAPRCELSPRGFEGLAEYLFDLEADLRYVAGCTIKKEV